MTYHLNKPLEITLPKILLVEGTHDRSIFKNLLDHLDITDIAVLVYDGVPQLPHKLRTLPVLPNFNQLTSISIVRDADKSYERTLQSIHSALHNAGLPVPDRDQRHATGNPDIHIFIMPDNINPGEIEDLFIEFAQSEPEWPCVDSYFSCLEQLSNGSHPKESKARIQAYLSSKREGNLHFGIAADKNYWNWDNHCFEEIKNFLLNL